ncbi:similar to Saccharomyces cerevisiae YNL192W CHS1 Chitin synthase I, requires activation from zymogenic form in order to catalyze the transfer of N- acetylglucosamine (GlcNAc) to chitin [Maudiozyma barnettii]|uniref:chitin synthase n=1 Tax=Maudiozyma barnettii TaxID=61262 RepID=A0A8H2VE20_9SACH|nr:chitin synthase CHS1 [Kazachstania barnettii]CAB4253879.1 similar to Saccharomyces cerevisiae YNL192W CHS1 Chitin synthase I, requires activation from zymogenic form in order to catalyze the transfer of N- acetylglucosamine (GlcNAc) to chitin [Kazachstania barnettii]CAD1781629.1 similar to Saccharomyces cerevisiae YNL192W CHS1 Chitin synthase I, requires activation from zymogenic form in order to catalyze the transfer of N- acetylglucosamine (GlcNAc) to chitin [Kazachstania barnettii]
MNNNNNNTNGIRNPYQQRNISNDSSYQSSIQLTPTEPLQYVTNNNNNTNNYNNSNPHENNIPASNLPSRNYSNFVSHQPTYDNNNNNTQTNNNINNNVMAPQEYNDVFISNTTQQPQRRVQPPNINITPASIVASESTQQGIDSPNPIYSSLNQRPQTNYFNDENYYQNTNSANNLEYPSNSQSNLVDRSYSPDRNGASPSIMSSDEDTKPILPYNGQPQSTDHFDPLAYRDPYDTSNHDLNEDIENSYIDHNGNDYEINSYLDRNGNMIDPYQFANNGADDNENFLNKPYSRTNHFDYSYSDGENSAEGSDLSLTHRDLGEYENDDFHNDLTTLDKMAREKTQSLISSADSKEMLFSTEDEDKILNNDGSNKWLPKREATEVRKFKLWRGNFIFDSPISKNLIDQYSKAVDNPSLLSNEFKFMRYQAITCEPNQLAQNNFTVRQLKYLRPRQTEMMIVITMYNEDHILLGRTLKGVMQNIKHMVRKKNSSSWGPDAWKKIVVCIVSDGRSKINEKSLALISSLGCYQDGFAKDEINGKKVNMHVYEHTTMVNIDNIGEDSAELVANETTVPVQLLFALKEQNQKKINSHRWAFEGFAELLQPNIVVLLDAGTMPGKDSIYELWREFRAPNVGGACGEIRTDLGKNFKNLVNPLIASQNFEYKMSNILDKTTESNFGFITVLPGAFSAYRFAAVRGEPLEKYFYGEKVAEEGLHFFSSNMYLAEDRILCFEIVVKKNASWVLKYCRSSYASTDVPERVPEFILQRRRWLNGSFFAGVYSFAHFYKIWTSGHNIGRKFLLNLEFIYLLFNTVVAWFQLSSFFLVFRILTLSIAVYYNAVFGILSVVFLWLYGISVFSTFILSLGNKPPSTEKYYVLNCFFFAVLMVYMIFCSVFMSVKSFESILNSDNITFKGLISKEAFRDLVISMGSTYVLYFVSSIIYLQPWHMFTSFVQYILLSPSYINVLNIYAFCNVHDISWGTKGSVAKPLGKITTKEDGTFKMEILVSSEEIQSNYNKYMNILSQPEQKEEISKEASLEEKKPGYYANVRSLVIIFWVMTNFGVCAAVLETGGIGDYLSMRSARKNNTTGTALSATDIERPLLTNKATVYFTIILYLVALSALIRFIGCSVYMVGRFFKRMGRR